MISTETNMFSVYSALLLFILSGLERFLFDYSISLVVDSLKIDA
jgi:hypothetical protein